MTQFDRAIIDDITKIELTHLWVEGFGWENTVRIATDYKRFEVFGMGDEKGVLIFLGNFDKGKTEILKGKIN